MPASDPPTDLPLLCWIFKPMHHPTRPLFPFFSLLYSFIRHHCTDSFLLLTRTITAVATSLPSLLTTVDIVPVYSSPVSCTVLPTTLVAWELNHLFNILHRTLTYSCM